VVVREKAERSQVRSGEAVPQSRRSSGPFWLLEPQSGGVLQRGCGCAVLRDGARSELSRVENVREGHGGGGGGLGKVYITVLSVKATS